jgi:hypothetical protein
MDQNRKDTRIHLVEELRKLPKSPEIDFMIKEAIAGEYHDFKNNKYACGKVESATRLDSLGFFELSSRIKNGEFDEEPDEEDRAELRKLFGRLKKRAKVGENE